MLDKKLIKNYLDYMKNIKEKSDNTIKNYNVDLNLLFNFMDENNIFDITEVKLQHLHQFLTFCVDRGDASSTRARRVATVKSFYSYLHRIIKIVDEDPSRDLEAPKINRTNSEYLTLSESKKLLQTINDYNGKNKERDFAIVTLFLNTGVRLSELVSIDIDDIKEDMITIMGKGSKERVVYLNNACQKALEDYLEVRKGSEDIALFLSNRGSRIANRTVQLMVENMLSRAGLDTDKLGVHSLRHSYGSMMLKHGENVDIRVLQRLMGHSDITTTQIYTHVDDEQLRDAAISNPLNI